jgi:hypothetical protein
MGGPPNKGMKLTSAEHIERSQPIPGVGRTEGEEEGHRWEGTLQHSSGHA